MKNAKTLPKLYFGLHMLPGCAEYREPGHEPFRIFVNEATIKAMDASFQGRPVYVLHKDEVDLENIQAEADGYVVRSFFNQADGKHWAEFIIVSDKGHEAIRSGWRLSNAYLPKEYAAGGLWNGIEYSKEVTKGEYEHLAIVPNPRYDESVIFTPDQFKEYCEKKELELKRLANSQGDKPVGLNIFKKTKVENALDYENTMVTLPKSKIDKSIAEAVAMADVLQNMAGYAADEHMVKMDNGEEMSVKDLKDSYCKMKSSMEEEAKKKENAELDSGEKKAEADKAASDKTENGDEALDKQKEQIKAEEKDVKKNHFQDLKDAPKNAEGVQTHIDLGKSERGKARYGSGK